MFFKKKNRNIIQDSELNDNTKEGFFSKIFKKKSTIKNEEITDNINTDTDTDIDYDKQYVNYNKNKSSSLINRFIDLVIIALILFTLIKVFPIMRNKYNTNRDSFINQIN